MRQSAKNSCPRAAWTTGCFVEHMQTPLFVAQHRRLCLICSISSLPPDISSRYSGGFYLAGKAWEMQRRSNRIDLSAEMPRRSSRRGFLPTAPFATAGGL